MVFAYLWRRRGEADAFILQRLDGGADQAKLWIFLEVLCPLHHKSLQLFTHLRMGLQRTNKKPFLIPARELSKTLPVNILQKENGADVWEWHQTSIIKHEGTDGYNTGIDRNRLIYLPYTGHSALHWQTPLSRFPSGIFCHSLTHMHPATARKDKKLDWKPDIQRFISKKIAVFNVLKCFLQTHYWNIQKTDHKRWSFFKFSIIWRIIELNEIRI